jgi:F0F1-type ATP synthase membrane subunit a
VSRIRIIVIVAITLIVIGTGFIVASGPEPHIAIPPEILWTFGFFNISSTMMASWAAMLILIVLGYFATRSMKLIPTGVQNFVEGLLDAMLTQMEEVAGREKARHFFMVVATFFLFILVANWVALLPFFKAVGITQDYGEEIFHEIQEQQVKGEPFDDDHHFLTWIMDDVGGVKMALPGAETFKFELHLGEQPGEALDRYIVALSEQFTDFRATDDEHPSEADVHGAWEALQADPEAPKFHGEGAHAALPAGSKLASLAEEEGVPSPALGVTLSSLEFPGQKVGMVYPFFRAAFSDVNNTLALAICAFFIIEFWGFQALGLGYLGKFFMNPLKNPIMTFVGFLELLSEFIRIISFTFRLFGNIFAGGVLILILTFLVPFIAPIGIYGLELFVGLIQAIVFAALTLVFAVGAVEQHGEDHESHGTDDYGHDPNAPGDTHAPLPSGAAQAH